MPAEGRAAGAVRCSKREELRYNGAEIVTDQWSGTLATSHTKVKEAYPGKPGYMLVEAWIGLSTSCRECRKTVEGDHLYWTTPHISDGFSECELHDLPGEPDAGKPHAGFGERRAETCSTE